MDCEFQLIFWKATQKADKFSHFSSIVAVSVILLVVCYKLDNTSADITWTISPIVLWAGTEINLGVVTACLPSLRPIFLLITKGTAQPNATSSSRQGNSNGALKSKVVSTFRPRGRNTLSFADVDVEDEHHPFSVIHEDPYVADRQYEADKSPKRRSSVHLDELQPPPDRVMVREDIYVRYTDV